MKFNTDVFFIILFIIIISIIVGLNIVSVIDKKISNVSVNVPPIDIPKPTVIVKINKCGDNKQVEVEKVEEIKDISPTNEIDQEIENFDTLNNNNMIVNIDLDENNKGTIEHMTNNLMPYNEALKKDSPHVKKNRKAYISSADYGWEAPRQFVSCANSSIAQKWKGGKKSLRPFQISCDQPNLLTAENYYKTHYKIPVIPMEDHDIRGANYYEFSDYPEPHAIDFRILSQSTKGIKATDTKLKNIPNGHNYGFHNTPAMKMP